MRVYELVEKLMKMPAGARVFVETTKTLEEFDVSNMSPDDEKIDVSFPAKVIGKDETDRYVVTKF